MGHTEIKGDVFLANDKIIIHGAREHNLKNVDVEIPRDKLIVFTGLSNPRLRSIQYTPRGKGGMSNRFHHMRASF